MKPGLRSLFVSLVYLTCVFAGCDCPVRDSDDESSSGSTGTSTGSSSTGSSTGSTG